MAIQSWLTFEAIKDLQANTTSTQALSIIEASGRTLTVDEFKGVVLIGTTTAAQTWVLPTADLKIGASAVIFNQGINDFDIDTGFAAPVTIASQTGALLIKTAGTKVLKLDYAATSELL